MLNKRAISRTGIINKLISDNNLNSYLEIGVSNPYTNFLSIKCGHKVSVDPCIECEFFSAESIEQFKPFITHQMTSDEFFAQNKETFDIVFIDGDHSFEQSLTDLNNALKIVPVNGFIVLHDAHPIDFNSTQLSNFQNKLPYNGEVWKTTICAIRQNNNSLQIGTFPYDFGVTIIKKLSDKIPYIKPLDLDYNRDFSIPALQPVYDVADFQNQKVSYFTGLFNTPQKVIERTTRTLLGQTNPNWEWVLHDDSNNDIDAKRLEKFFAGLNEPRIKYYRFNTQLAQVGPSKKRAANLCTGDYLAELDHDDLLMPDLTEWILKHGDGFDFIYSNTASVIVNDDESFSQGEHFGDSGFAMGYGSYRQTIGINPLTGFAHKYQECVCVPINPKTIRNIVSVPNHVRVWSKGFYDAIGGHNINMGVADDYELIVRSFLAGGKFLHLDMLGYLQVEAAERTTYTRNWEIQVLWNSVLATLDDQIAAEFKLRNMQDWAYEYYAKNFGFKRNPEGHGLYQYYNVPTLLDVPMVNSKVSK